MTMDESQEKAWVLAQYDGMLAAGTPAPRKAYLLEHPVLLASAALQIIQAERADEPNTTAALVYLDQARRYLWQNTSDYPPGLGPLQKVVAALRVGDIDYEEAMRQALDIECCGQLSHTYVRAVMMRWTDELQNDVTFTMQAAEIGLEAALAMPCPRLALDVRRAAAEGFIRLVHGGLMRRPDGRLFARALEMGEWGWQDAEQRGKMGLKGDYLNMLGAMALDAYAANFGPSPDYPAAIEEWLARALDPMPKAVDGLAQARAYLSAAVELRDPGSPRGNTLKALLEAVVYEAFARGERPDRGQAPALADRALADLNPTTDQLAIDRVLVLRGLCE
jgi:hypothetical protein